MAHLGVVNVHTVFLVCLAAVLGGDCAAFFLGRYFGRRILGWGPAQRLFSARKQLRVRAYFRKYGSKVIFVGRFLPGLRFSIFFSAGTLHVRPAVFLIYNSLAALLSVPFLVYLAWIFGEHIDRVIRWARRSEYGILVVAVLAGGFRAVQDRPLPPPAPPRAAEQDPPPAATVPAAAAAAVAPRPPPAPLTACPRPTRAGRRESGFQIDPFIPLRLVNFWSRPDARPQTASQRSNMNSVHSCFRRSRRPDR